jgi:hypothetical protein
MPTSGGDGFLKMQGWDSFTWLSLSLSLSLSFRYIDIFFYHKHRKKGNDGTKLHAKTQIQKCFPKSHFLPQILAPFCTTRLAVLQGLEALGLRLPVSFKGTNGRSTTLIPVRDFFCLIESTNFYLVWEKKSLSCLSFFKFLGSC